MTKVKACGMTQNSDVPARIVPASVPSQKDPQKVHYFPKHVHDFLRAYAGCLDEDQAFNEARVDTRVRAEILRDPHVQEEMGIIQQTYRYQSRMTTGFVAGKHMELMDKVEKEFDGTDSKEHKARFAAVLAKLSDGAMKATGLIGTQTGEQMPMVVMNLNTGGAPANVQINQGAAPVVTENKSNDA